MAKPTTRKPVAKLAEARMVADLPLVEGGEPPSEFRLFARGVNHTSHGDFLFDDQAAISVMATYRQKGRARVPGDWEHAALEEPAALADGGAPATCWYALELRDGELWAVDVKWTPRAYAQIKDGEYAHFSPAYLFDTENGNRIMAWINLGLTNLPATYGQAQLVACSEAAERNAKMNDDQKAALTAAVQALATALAGTDPAAIQSAMDALSALLAQQAGDEQPGTDEQPTADSDQTPAPTPAPAPVPAPVAASSDQPVVAALAALTGKKTVGEQVATLAAWREAGTQVAALSDRVAKLESEKKAGEFKAVVTQAQRDGKLTLGMLSDKAKGAGAYVAALEKTHDVAALSAFVSALPRVVPAGGALRELPTEASSLTAEDEAVAKQLGVPIAKLKEKRAARQ